ncbi:hypothetical protein JZO70_11740 [Enterococcus sp. 669A]|uniref:Uncharacterized protein n=1 Tax=Candidatus Enterococcus moelleringii TaxID=2815325 RepID=A0ABS3LB28_9ENTE|nr:hypothetical protein [Enterococcus sp. 669A]MBO1306839.1 hypothetical protein [Enterococcus sp. 669A]
MSSMFVIATLVGAFIFPFILRLSWDRLIEHFGPFGGWMAAAFLVGTMWTLNHGVGLIHQSGGAWIDQGFAAGIGLLVATKMAGGSFNGNVAKNILGSAVGGLIAGFVLSLIL